MNYRTITVDWFGILVFWPVTIGLLICGKITWWIVLLFFLHSIKAESKSTIK